MAALGSTPGIIVGVGVGSAVAAAIEPALEVAKQEAWKRNDNKVNGAELIARLVAQGGIELGNARNPQEGTAYEAAQRHGYAPDKLDQLVYLAQTTPDVAAALHLWRRGFIAPELWTHVLRKHGLDARYFPGLNKSYWDILSQGELAAAIHRGLVRDPAGLLKGEQPQPPFKIEAYPVYDIDAKLEAEGHGYDLDHLGVLVGLQGLPMGTHEAAQAFFRGIITHGDYVRAFNESNSRNEWAEAVLGYSRQIPTARDFLENALRGYRDLNAALEGAALHGMSPEHATMIYQNQGRPMAIRLITQALARGGKFKPEPGEIKDPYDAAIVEGNLKPAYYDLAKSLRYTQPTPFAIRQLAQAGTWDQKYAETKLLYLGWEPKDAHDVSVAWAKPTTAGADSHVTSEQTRLRTRTHTSYIAGEITKTVARNALGVAGVSGPSITAILGIWDAEKALFRKQLTPAQVKKAYKKGSRNAATGAAWTRDEAIAALLDLGYAPLVANDFLDIP